MSAARRKSSRQPLLGSHQKCWIWGRNVVVETLQAQRWKPVELVVSTQLDPTIRREIDELAHASGILIEAAAHARLTELCHSREHQGLLAKMPPYPYAVLDDVLDQASTVPLLVLLDALQDPFNFGAICRAACVYGADGLIIPRTGQVGVTSQVARSSAGAVNRLRIARTDDLGMAVRQLKSRGISVVATTLSANCAIHDFDFRQPIAVLFGNEGAGVQADLASECSAEVTIPQATEFDSLNAAVAAGIVLYEIYRQRVLVRRQRPS